MLRLRRDDFEDPHELAKFAATAGMSLQQFRDEFEPLIRLEPPPLQLAPEPAPPKTHGPTAAPAEAPPPRGGSEKPA